MTLVNAALVAKSRVYWLSVICAGGVLEVRLEELILLLWDCTNGYDSSSTDPGLLFRSLDGLDVLLAILKLLTPS